MDHVSSALPLIQMIISLSLDGDESSSKHWLAVVFHSASFDEFVAFADD